MEVIQTLIVCEKPDAAARVARALDEDGDPHKINARGVPYYEARRRQETIIVCSALGHLYSIDSKGRTPHRYYPIWDYRWEPKHLIDKKSARLNRWIQTISSLARNADRFINGCDYDPEGSLIGYTILRYACSGAHAKAQRMKFSTMTEKELQTAYGTALPQLDYSQVEAGRCRHELDWLYGINLSRLLTESALKQNRGYSTLSSGRVQGPTLKFVVQREEEIQCFTPTPFWTIDATIQHQGQTYPLEYTKEKVPTLAEATQISVDCKNALLEVANIETQTIQQPPPYPFDLSTLQSEAYRHFGYTPSRTLALAERLYLDALISYPRTSSQKLPPDVGYSEILRGIAARAEYRSLVSKLTNRTSLRPTQGPRQDSAHPAIYPTGESPKRRLLHHEANLLDLIIKRFMATFAESSLLETTKLTLRKDQHSFFLKGSKLLKDGWIEFYHPYGSEDDQKLPDLRLGDKVPIKKIDALERFTEPPSRYNPSSLLRKMEQQNIGTKATRAEIIEILYRRGYIKDIRIQATPVAAKIISILDRYCPMITDSGFTSQVESQMEEIRSGSATRRGVLGSTLERLRPIMLQLISKEEALGSQLAEAVATQRKSNVTLDHPCPSCGSSLMIIRSRASGKRFIGCAGYAKGCRFTLPLPQFGSLTITRRSCKVCGFQLITARSGRRRMNSCPRCYSNKARQTAKIISAVNSIRISPSDSKSLLEGAPLVQDE